MINQLTTEILASIIELASSPSRPEFMLLTRLVCWSWHSGTSLALERSLVTCSPTREGEAPRRRFSPESHGGAQGSNGRLTSQATDFEEINNGRTNEFQIDNRWPEFNCWSFASRVYLRLCLLSFPAMTSEVPRRIRRVRYVGNKSWTNQEMELLCQYCPEVEYFEVGEVSGKELSLPLIKPLEDQQEQDGASQMEGVAPAATPDLKRGPVGSGWNRFLDAYGSTSLKRINFLHRFPMVAAARILPRLTNLTRVRLAGPSEVVCDSLFSLWTDPPPCLVHLALNRIIRPGEDSEHFAAFLLKIPALQHLQLKHSTLSIPLINVIAEHTAKTLLYFDVAYCTPNSAAFVNGLGQILQNAQKLQYALLSGQPVLPSHLASLPISMRGFDGEGCVELERDPDATLEAVARLINMTDLRFPAGMPLQTEQLCSTLQNLTKLERLGFAGTDPIPESVLRTLGKNCPHLVLFESVRSPIPEAGLGLFQSGCPKIVKLAFSCTSSTELSLDFGPFAELRYLQLWDVEKLPSRTLSYLVARCPKLQFLTLDTYWLEAAHVTALASSINSCPMLTTLHLNSFGIGGTRGSFAEQYFEAVESLFQCRQFSKLENLVIKLLPTPEVATRVLELLVPHCPPNLPRLTISLSQPGDAETFSKWTKETQARFRTTLPPLVISN